MNITEYLKKLTSEINAGNLANLAKLLKPSTGMDLNSQDQILGLILESEKKISIPLLEFLYNVSEKESKFQLRIYETIIEVLYTNQNVIVEKIKNAKDKTPLLFVKLAGDLENSDVIPHFITRLNNETDKNILSEILYSLGKIGNKEGAKAVAEFLFFGDEMLKEAAIKSLSTIGGELAANQLFSALEGGNDIDLLIIDSLSDIQDMPAIEKLSELLKSEHENLRNASMKCLINIGPKSVPLITENLKSSNSDEVIHSMTTLGHIGDDKALPAILKVLNSNPEDSNIRFAIYEAMERIPSKKSAISLANGLHDPVEQVRMAAAKAVDKNLSPVLIAGMKNMISNEDAQSDLIVGALINSGSEEIFKNLSDLDSFKTIAKKHIVTGTAPETKAKFIGVMKKLGNTDFADDIEKIENKESLGDETVVYVVDDSKMMLRLYSNKLYAMGYQVQTYHIPEEALTETLQKKPDILITDLNMPGLNGMQLSKAIRKKYSIEELPILMITTQSDFIGEKSSDTDTSITKGNLKNSGVNEVLHKPFKDEELSAVLKGFRQ